MLRGIAIARHVDGRAIMEGSNACSVRWGADPHRLRVYASPEQAAQSLRLLCDDEDQAYICDAAEWKHAVDAARQPKASNTKLESLMNYAVQIAIEDRDLLPLTEVGAYTESIATSGKTMVYSTFDRAVFDRWCRALDAAGRKYEKLI